MSSIGAIMSPNYPQPYGRNGECTWKILVAHGSLIRLSIIDLDLEDHSTCSLDYLEIFDGKTRQSPKLAKICSQLDHPSSITSKSNSMLLRFRSDISRQGRGFNIKYETVCNITLKGYRGTIESPGYPDNSFIHRECLWKIQAPAGNKINLTFTDFVLTEAIPDNSSNFVKIYDGFVNQNSLLNTFTSLTPVPSQLISSNTDVVYIHYQVFKGALLTGNKFRLEWVVSGCGGIFRQQKKGEISSPNYPKPYPHNTDCEWFISVLPGNSIKLTIDDLHIEDMAECKYDALEIHGGPDDVAPLLARLCKKITSPTTLTTSGNEAFIRFKSDHSNNGYGFHASFVMVPSTCGGEFRSSSGSIHSHNYPQNYDEHDDCNYIIRVGEGHTVNLTFTDFDVDAVDTNCSNAFVKVYDGDSAEAPLLQTLCGNHLPPSIISSQNSLFVRHKTDGFAVAKGFLANYNTACGGIIYTDNMGTINFSDMNSTLSWSEEYNCSWIIKSKWPHSKVRLQFSLLEVAGSEYKSYTNLTENPDGLFILSGEGEDAPLFRHYARKRLPTPIIVPSSVVTVVYRRTGTVDYESCYNNCASSRFILDYSVLDTACGGTALTGVAGTIVSPNYPDPYPSNIECIWTLLVAPGNTMGLTFTKFGLQDSDLCNADFVEVRLKDESGPLLGLFCGNSLPGKISANTTLWIKFRSAEKNSGPGFEADFSLETTNDLAGISGTIASPLYPLSFHSAGYYSWRITVRPRRVIRFAFSAFMIDSGSSDDEVFDCFNSLVVYDGFADTSPLLNTLCGLHTPAPFSSQSNVVLIQLKQNYAGIESRFLLNWMETIKTQPANITVLKENNCTFLIELSRKNNASHNFKSPGFPQGYPNNANCEWIFQAPVGDHIFISFSTINLEETHSCRADSITIYHGDDPGSSEEWVQKQRLCRENDTSVFYRGNRLMKVVFKSDFTVNKTGFSGRASTTCGGAITEPNGVLKESSYSNCQWNITVKRGRTIKLTLEKFALHGSPPCLLNRLVLRDGGNADSPFLGNGTYCGDSVFDIPETTSNKLYIAYRAGSTEGFTMRFEEKSLSCGDTVTLSQDFDSFKISSPNYPNVPPPHIECIWRVIAPSGESIHFEVNKRFDMAWSKGCALEYLELKEGGTEMGHSIGRYCTRTPSFITTTDNSLFIKYFTDTDFPKDGFSATVSISKCGGTIYTFGENGTIVSPGFPKQYDGNLNCTWKLVARTSSVLQLNFSYSLGGSRASCNKSRQDTLTLSEILQDGLKLIGPEEMTFCGEGSIFAFESEVNEVLINFQSVKQQGSGLGKKFFKVVYRDIPRKCGGSINSPSGFIQSPYYPGSFEGMIYCSWRITVPQGRRVTFYVNDLDLIDGSPSSRPQWVAFYNGFRYNRIKLLTGSQRNTTVIESSGNKMMITFRSIHKTGRRGFSGNFTSIEPALCGGTVFTDADSPSGDLMIDKSLIGVNKSFSCEWEILTRTLTHNTITISFEGNLNPSDYLQPECYYSGSRLLFLDVKSKLISDFCRVATASDPFIVSKPNDRTLVQLTKPSSIKGNNGTYSLKWKINECGSVLAVTSAPITITSPGNNISYPANTDCVWSVSSADGSNLKIHFTKFDLGSDCKDDFLKIHNGNSPLSPVMNAELCGSIIPADLISQSSSVWIHFHSGIAKATKGFSFEISQADNACGGIFHMKSGELRSPSYPSNYKDLMECDWELQSPIGFHIGLTFVGRFFIEDSSGCAKDSLQILDYVNGTWVPLAKLCGRNFPSNSFNSTSNRMRVLFKSDGSVSGDGFRASFNWNCGGTIEVLDKGDLYSPGWPNVYPSSLDCNYTLVAPKKLITVRTQTFELESGANGCRLDKVQFFTRKQLRDLKSDGIFCGKTAPAQVVSYESLKIRFTTDDFFNLKGFHFIYSISNCGGEIRSDTVISGSDIDPQSEDWTRCVWNVTAPDDKIVKIKISQLKLRRTMNCIMENVVLYDTSQSPNGTLLGKICGLIENVPAYFKSSGNKMQIQLSSFRHELNKPLTIIVTLSDGPKQGCGGEISLNSSNELTVIDQNGQYKNNMDCSWTVTAPPENTVLISFVKLDLKPCTYNATNETCCDYVEIFDGSSVNTMSLGKYCGGYLPRSISSSQRYVTVLFSTDDDGNTGGLIIKAKAIVSPCGKKMLNATAQPQLLTSPNFPNNYPINVHCDWLVVAERYVAINIHFDVLDIENSTDCNADRLEIRDLGYSTWRVPYRVPQQNIYAGYNPHVPYQRMPSLPPLEHKFCGKGRPLDVYSLTNRVAIRFISDSQGTSKGFKLYYSFAGCSRNYTETQGRIVISRSTSNCDIVINSPQNTTISLYFLSISIFKREQCVSKVEIFEGQNKTGEACGYVAPPPVFSKGNTMTLKLSTRSGMGNNLDVYYTSTDQGQGCGGEFFNSFGAFTSPFYPGSYRNSTYCCWEVTVPYPSVPKITFKEFDIGSPCSEVYVEMFDVNSENGDRVKRTTYCGRDKPADFIGVGPSVALCYKTSIENTGVGWSVEFRAKSDRILSRQALMTPELLS